MTEVESENERLRRHLRAMSAMNRQLQAQLAGGGGLGTPGAGGVGGDLLTGPGGYFGGAAAGSPRRVSVASAWLEQLQLQGTQEPTLVRRADGHAFVVEGERRREIKSGLLAAALEQSIGEAREVGPDELERWTEGAPVEVLEGPKGPAFVVVGCRRLPIRGLPLPHPVSADEMQMFPEGAEINVAAANVARSRFDGAVSGRYHLGRVQRVLQREGPVRGSVGLVKRAARRLRRAAR